MTGWTDILDFLRGDRFVDMEVEVEPHEEAAVLTYPVDSGRRQRVWVARSRSTNGQFEFVALQSDFGYAKPDLLDDTLVQAERYLIGGVVRHGEMLAVRHAIALPQPDLAEFERSLDLIAKIADQLEEKYGTIDVL
jgi:hypothetical protein